MKLITRTNNIRSHVPVPDIAFVNAETCQPRDNVSQEQKSDPKQIQIKQEGHNLHFLQIKVQSPANSGKCKYDRSVTTLLESNPICESGKNTMTNSYLTDWKILTLQQLRRKNRGQAHKQQGKSSDRSRGIYVSVSQSKRNHKSRQKHQKRQQDKAQADQHSPYFKCLSSLSKKGQLIDRLQTHLIKKQQGTYFC